MFYENSSSIITQTLLKHPDFFILSRFVNSTFVVCADTLFSGLWSASREIQLFKIIHLKWHLKSFQNNIFEYLNICGLVLTDGGVTAADTGSQPSLSPLRCKHSSDLFDNICVGEAEEEGHCHPLGGGGQRGHYLGRTIIRKQAL